MQILFRRIIFVGALLFVYKDSHSFHYTVPLLTACLKTICFALLRVFESKKHKLNKRDLRSEQALIKPGITEKNPSK